MKRSKILMIDDDKLFLKLTEMSLKDSPSLENIDSFDDVEEARAYLESCKANTKPFPDAIFVDMNMPIMNGIDFAKLFAEEYSQICPRTKLVMLTCSISRKEKAKAMAIPAVSDFIEKPLTEEKLRQLLSKEIEEDRR